MRYTNEHGLVDYRAPARTEPTRHGWIWLVLLIALIVLFDVVLKYWLRASVGP